MIVDTVARATAFSTAIATARMAQKMAASGALSEIDVEEIRIIAMDPFDRIQIGNPALDQPETAMLQRMRDLLDGEWDSVCAAARDPGP